MRRSQGDCSLSFSDICIEPEAEPDSGGECRQRTPTGNAGLPGGVSGNGAKEAVCQELEDTSSSLWKKMWRSWPFSKGDVDDYSLGLSPKASPLSSQIATSKTFCGRLRRRLRVRSTLAVVLSIGILLVLAVATTSIWFFHASGKEEQKEKLPSSCATAQNGTATCSHFEAVGDHLWDASVNDLLSGSADSQDDCCRGCDSLSDCQGWMYEHMAKSCRWIRFLEQPCASAPGDLSCRCVTHYGMTFGFKPTSQIVWVKRPGV